MIGQIKEVEVDGVKYELKKQGVNTSLTIQSIFVELVLKANVLDDDLSQAQLEMVLMAGMRGPVLRDIQSVIQKCVFSPKITPETYDEITLETIPRLFLQLYFFHVKGPEKKSDSQNEPSNIQTEATEPESSES